MLDGLAMSWSWSVSVIAFLALVVVVYSIRVWQVARTGSLMIGRVVTFFAAILLIALLLLSPINTIARTQLFSVHAGQLVILMMVCAPLVLVGCPENILRPVQHMPVLKSLIALLTKPLVPPILFSISFLVWHSPRVYNATIANEAIYHTMMIWLLCLAVLLWWPLLGSLQTFKRLGYLGQLVYATVDGQALTIMAFVLVNAQDTLYNNTIPASLPVSAFADQSTGGAIFLLSGLADFIVATPIFVRWFAQIEQKTRLADIRRQQEREEEELYEEESSPSTLQL